MQSYLQVHGPRPRPSAKVDIDPAIDEPIVRALAPDPQASGYGSPRELFEALRAIIAAEPRTGGEQDVVALYVEGGPAELALAYGDRDKRRDDDRDDGARQPHRGRDSSSISRALRTRLDEIAQTAKVALGASRATICGGVVDGPALDVEGWAPYPLDSGLWITPSLL